jgi:hypothetical protein
MVVRDEEGQGAWFGEEEGRLSKNPSRIRYLSSESALEDIMGPVWHPGTVARCSRWGSCGGEEGAGEVPCGSLRSARCRANRWGTPLPHHRRQRGSAEAVKEEVLSKTRPPPCGRRERLDWLGDGRWGRREGNGGAGDAQNRGHRRNLQGTGGLGKDEPETRARQKSRSRRGREGWGREGGWGWGLGGWGGLREYY